MAEGQKQLGRINSADRERERTEARLSVLEATIERYKQSGVPDGQGHFRPWQDFREEEKFDRIFGRMRLFHLENEPAAYNVLAREVDLARLPEASASAARDPRDGLPTPEEWRRLQAEWRHDYGLRRMENRGVKYQDETERRLDHAAARGNAQADATAIPAGRATEPRHPWPSEVAEQVRHQPGPDHGHDNGHDNGHSM